MNVGGKATIVKDVQTYLGLKAGDHILFYKTDSDDVVIKKG